MAFNLTANINARLANGGAIASQLRKQLSANPIGINVKLTGSAEKASKALTGSLKDLNAQIRAISANSRTASSAINQLSASFSKFKSGAQNLAQTARAAKTITAETKKATDQVGEFGRVAGLALRRNTGFLLATGAVYGLGRAITSSFSEAIRFEKELVKIAQVSNRSVASLKPLADEISRLSVGLGVASADLVDVSLILAQAGLSANETRQALDALAKTTLAATFGSIQDTTEGAIALMAQFEIKAKDLGKALGATNAVSAAFAVESEDIIAAVKRAGGVFAQTSKGVTSNLGAFNEFIAVFSAVRSTTRESAESIATGLRTIFTRIQRPATIQFLKELGVELTDLNGRFVGPFEAVNRLSKGLEGLDRRGSSFARVAEELGGFRQIGKTLALLSSSTQRLEALQVAQQGQNSVNKDAEQAQQSLANAIQKTKENFTALIREIGQTKTFDFLVRTTLKFANALIKLADSIKPLIPLLTAFAAVKGINIAARFYPDFKKSLGGKGFAVGGRVSGGKGGKDDIPAMLTAGEYVINKKSANMIGRENLDELNRVGLASGGPVGRVKMATGGDPEEELAQLRKLDAKLGKGQGARKERTRLLNSIRDKTLRNETTDPSLLGIGRGGITPRFEANLGSRSVSGNSGARLTGNLSEAKLQEKLAQQNKQRIERNKRFNAEEARLQQEDIRIRKQIIQDAEDYHSETSRIQDLAKQNNRQVITGGRARQGLPQFTGTGGLAGIQSQQTLDPAIIALRQQQALLQNAKKPPRVTGSRTTSIRDIMRTLSVPVGAAPLADLQSSDFGDFDGSSQNVTSTFRSKRRVPTSQLSFRNRARLLGTQFSTGLQNQLPTFSRLGDTKIGRAVTSRLPKGSRLVAAGALAGGVIAGDKIGGTLGGAITGATGGAFTGAALGSAFGPVGTGVGAAVGGIIGALQGFIDADLDAKIKNASDNIIRSISDVETGFEGFQQAIARIGGGDISAALTELTGSFAGLSQNVVNSSRVERGLNPETIDTRLSLTENEKQQAFAGLSANRRLEVIAEENKNIEIFGNRKSDLGSAGEAAKSALNEQLSRGIDFDKAVSSLGPSGQVALAFATAKDKSAQIALGQAATSGRENLQATARAQVLGGDLRIQNDEEIKRKELLKKGAQELANINSQTDLFIERMTNLSAVLDRASQAGEGFRRSNEALLSRRSGGAGIRSQTRTNVFDNTKAFTEADITKEALRVNSFLGNNANSREATQGVIGAKQLQTKLPGILNALSVGVRAGGESNTLLPELINKGLGGVPEVLRNKLQSDIRTKFFANDQSSPDDIANALAGGDVTDLQGSSQEVTNTFKKLVDATNQKITEYEQVLDQYIQLNREANDAQDTRLQILNDSNNEEKALLGQERLTIADKSRGFNTQLSQFAGRAGSGSSVQELIAREASLNATREGGFTGSSDEVARQMARLTEQQNESLRALELIAGNTERQNAISEELNGLIDSRRQARQIFEDFASGSPTERRQIERNIDLARRQNEGENFFGERLKQAKEGQNALQAIIGATQGQAGLKTLDQQQIGFLDRSGADRLFGAAGVNPGVGVGGLLNNNDAFFQQGFSQLQDINRQRGAAAAGIEDINRRDANQVEQNGRNAFNSFQAGVQNALAKGGLLDVLNSTLSSLPEVIQIGGSVDHNININGAEVLAGMEPTLRKIVIDHVNFEINKRMNPLTGETAPA
jgi:TP901 family phage tail tape measure protein